MKKQLFVGSLFLCLLILLCYSGYIFFKGQQAILAEIHRLLDETIHLDSEYRLKEVTSLSSSGYDSSDCDSTTILYSGGNVEKIAQNAKSDDLITEDKQYRVDQSFLLIENPINIIVLDSLFNLVLQQSDMVNVNTALTYTLNNNSTIYSCQDLTFYQPKRALPPIVTGVKDEIVLQAYVDIPFSYLINKNIEHFIILLVVFFLILSILFVTWYNKNLLIPIQEDPRELIKIKENLLFDKERGIIYYNGDNQVYLENYKLKLFILLVDSPGHFQTSEEIKRIVWGKVGATTDTLNTTIKRVRINLKSIPDLKIVFENKGYRLEIL